jgi:hypothetical protein
MLVFYIKLCLNQFMNQLKFHPSADLFPLLEGSEFEALKADIAHNGLIQPIVICGGEILDGRNRYRACVELGIEYATIDYTGDSPTAHAWSLNGNRRHLNTSQLAAIAANMLPALQQEAAKREAATQFMGKDAKGEPIRASGGSTWNPPKNEGRGKSLKTAAAIAGVGATTVYRADYVKQHDPELFEKVVSGEITAAAAERKLKDKSTLPVKGQPKEQRLADIARLAAGGHRAQQIAAQLGITVQHVRLLANEGSIELPDRKMGKLRAIDACSLVERTITGIAGFASGLRVIKNVDLPIAPDLAAEYAAELGDSLHELTWLQTRMKEISK